LIYIYRERERERERERVKGYPSGFDEAVSHAVKERVAKV
jgi:hypothetical protein